MRNNIVDNNVHRRLDRNEFAHLFLGESVVSDLSPRNLRKIEWACNRLEAEFLVPS